MPKSPPPHNPRRYKKCDECGKEILIRHVTTRFCGRVCAGIKKHKDHIKTLNCVMCKKDFTRKRNYDVKTCSAECLLSFKTGKNSPTWKGGIKKDRDRRKSYEMVQWRKSVFARDSYKCQMCGIGGFLYPHHIFFYALFPKLRAVVANGISLCPKCHASVHKTIRKSFFEKTDKQLLETVVLHSKYRDWLFQSLLLLEEK